ncbi:MAG: glycerophosphodiester phosphodiesterase [Anaerolineales bacterium]
MASFPSSWWRERPLVFGHRGASRVAPENTLPAFRRAAEMGADGVELDVYLTADGVPVVIHNRRLAVTTDGAGDVTRVPLADLRTLDAGAHHGPAFTGVPVPTLEEVLREIGGQLLVNIEIKPVTGRGTALEEAVAVLVRRLALEERVWFSSFKPYSLRVVRSLLPEVPCGLLYGPLSPGSLLLAPLTPHEALHPHYRLLSARRVQRAHRRGLRVAAWTVDDPDEVRRLAEWGVDVIITNTPDLVLAALEGRGAA